SWKKTMQVFQTAGVPPSRGRIILAMIGWTRNRRVALTKSVSAKSSRTGTPPPAAPGPGAHSAVYQPTGRAATRPGNGTLSGRLSSLTGGVRLESLTDGRPPTARAGQAGKPDRRAAANGRARRVLKREGKGRGKRPGRPGNEDAANLASKAGPVTPWL